MKLLFILVLTIYIVNGYAYQQQIGQQESVNMLSQPIIATKTNYSVLLGVLVKNVPKGLSNPSEYVLEDGYLYQGAEFRINQINIVNKSESIPANWVGKPVVIYYRLKKDLNQILTIKSKASDEYGREESMMQIRSDWTAPETGFNVGRSTKEKLKNISYYEVYDIVPYQGFSITKNEESVSISIRNDFDVTMSDIEVTGHFEGGMGKPRPKYVKNKFKGLNSRVSLDTSFKTVIPNENSKRRSFSLRNIIVSFHLNSEEQRIKIPVY